MEFVNTKRFSPVAFKIELPWDDDLFHYKPNEIPKDKKGFKDFMNKTIPDEAFWREQERRCRQGYSVANAIKKGGDAIIDGVDCIWNDDDKYLKVENYNFDKDVVIPPNSCYLMDLDQVIIDKVVTITNRHYWYLNFWKIYGTLEGMEIKDYVNPRFTMLDYFAAGRIRLQEIMKKDSTDAKGRQTGYTEKFSGMILGWNYTFVRNSINLIIGGRDGDADKMFNNTLDGLENISNTQFYKERNITDLTNGYFQSRYSKASIRKLSAYGNSQTASRFTPYWVIYEELGKWEKGRAVSTQGFVESSIKALETKTGFESYIGTGGEMDKGAADLMEFHYSKNENKFLRWKNKFEREPTEGKSGWFTSKSWFKILDSDGNPKIKESIALINKEIESEKDPKKRFVAKTQEAIYAGDAFLISTSGYFGEEKIMKLNNRLMELNLNPNLQIERHGILEPIDEHDWNKGMRFIHTDNDSAWITIVEEPQLDSSGKAYRDLYEVGTDSYDQDESKTSSSKGAAVVRKKFLNTNSTFKLDVAMINERPKTEKGGSEMFYKHTLWACIYYGYAKNTIEHSNLLIFAYYKKMKFINLLAKKPSLIFANKGIESDASNEFGLPSSAKKFILPILADDLTDEFISNMFIKEQIIALAKFEFRDSYNCDITMASAEAAAAAKESESVIAYSESENKEERKVAHYINVGNKIKLVYV